MTTSAPSLSRAINIPWKSLIIRADPDWAADDKMQVEDERRPNVKQNIRTRGPYAP